jgi:phospholipid-translocating ATPase
MVLKNAAGELEHYAILHLFPFSSARKRMGIIVKQQETGRIIFYLKGAEDIMKTRVTKRFEHEIVE